MRDGMIAGICGFLATSIVAPEVVLAQAGFGLEEVVVTARKREESLQETPVAVSVFTSNDLKVRSIPSTDRLADVTPNLTFDAVSPSSGSNATSQIFIRGIGQTDFTGVTDPGVGLYIDGVYYARSAGGALDFLDIDRIEILRGPQGTLFGRNTIGGAVVIHSKRPADEFGGYVELETGSDDKLFATGTVNMPFTDQLKTSLSLSRRMRDGYVTRLSDQQDLGDDDTWGARMSAVWTPISNVELYAIADYTSERENGPPTVSKGINDLQLFAGIVNILDADCPLPPGPPVGRDTMGDPRCANDTADIGPYENNDTFPEQSDFDGWGLSGTLTWEATDWLTVKSITAYRGMEVTTSRDGDHTDFDMWATKDDFQHYQISQELQFSGRAFDQRLNWLLGLYYFEEETDNPNPVFPQTGYIMSGGVSENDSKAVFAQATYDVTEQLALTAGIRYTKDRKRFTPEQFFLTGPPPAARAFFGLPPGLALSPGGVFPVGYRILPEQQFKESFDDWTPMVNVSYRWTEKLMTYFTWSEGFKTGGFDQRFAAPPIDPDTGLPTNRPSTFDPETVSSFEVGVKTDLFDNRMRLNAAAFYTDYQDLQIIIRETFNPITFNGGDADILGFEIETTIVPNPNLLITAAVGYIDAEYDRLDDSVINNPTPVLPDYKLVNTPEWSANIGAAYTFSLPDWGTLTPRVDWSFHDEQYNDAVNTPQLFSDSYHLVNLALIFDSHDGHWQVALGGTNVADEEYLITGNSAYQTAAAYTEAVYGRPAEWYLSVRYNFSD